jgi:3-deoxy-D-manno-octulosonic-acid transferase
MDMASREERIAATEGKWKNQALLAAYRGCLSLAYAVGFPYLARRYREGLAERRGFFSESLCRLGRRRPLWVHAVSVGEVQAASPFIAAARENGFSAPLVLSTTTPTGRTMAERLVGPGADAFFYYPWDVPCIVRRAVSTLRPRGYVVMETEVWPELLGQLHGRGIPLFLVNGRLSERTFRKALRWRSFWSMLLNRFTLLLFREEEDGEKARFLGVEPERIHVVGDAKVEALLRRRDKGPFSLPAAPPPGGPIFVAGSTHEGEEEIVLDAFYRVRRSLSNARLVLVPRHPERAEAILALLRARNEERGEALHSERLSRCDLSASWTILVVDRVGVLFEVYRWGQSAFVGGSLVQRGGQNLLEPAVWGVPVQHGPFVEDFAAAAAKLGQRGMARTVRNAEELAEVWMEHGKTGAEERRADRGRAFFNEEGCAASKAWQLVSERLMLKDHGTDT